MPPDAVRAELTQLSSCLISFYEGVLKVPIWNLALYDIMYNI
jgi:hypothetical protein